MELVSGRVSHLPSWGSPLTSLNPTPAPDHEARRLCPLLLHLLATQIFMGSHGQNHSNSRSPRGLTSGVGWMEWELQKTRPCVSWTLLPLRHPSGFTPVSFPTHSLHLLATLNHFTSPGLGPPGRFLPLRENSSPSPLCVQLVLFALRDQSRHHALHPASCSHPVTATTKLVSGFSLYSQGLAV